MSGRPFEGIALVLCAMCVGSVCEAQGIPREHVIVGAGAQRMAGGDGGSLSFAWTRVFDAGVLSAGASQSEVGPSHWTLMHVGGAHSLPGEWTLSGGVDLGPARIDGVASTFAKFRADSSVTVLERWTLSVEETFVDVGNIRGHLLTGGSLLSLAEGMSFHTRLSGSVHGNLDQQTLSFRFDHRGTRPQVLAGLVFGRSNNRLLLNVSGVETGTNRWLQRFVGIAVALKPFDLTVFAESAELGDVRRKALSFSFSLPVGPSG